MAERNATIRVKIQGVAKAGAELDTLNQQIARQQEKVAKALTAASSNMATADAEGYRLQLQREKKRLASMNERRTVLEKAKRDEYLAAQAEGDKFHANELKQQEKARTANEADRQEEIKREHEKAEATRKANADALEQQAKDWEKGAVQKADAFQEESKAQQQAAAAQEEFHADAQDRANKLHAQQMSQQAERDRATLRSNAKQRDSEHKNQVAKRKENRETLEKMVEDWEKGESRQADAIEKVRKMGKERQGSARDHNSGFGAKMILGVAAGQAAGSIAHDSSAGVVFGGAVSAALFGGPAIAAAVVAMEALSTSISNYWNLLQETARGQRAFTEALGQTSAAYGKVASGQINRNALGSAMVEAKAQATAGKLAVDQKLSEIIPQDNVRMSVWDVATGNAHLLLVEQKNLFAQRDVYEAARKKADEEEKAEYPKKVAGEMAVFGAKQKVYGLDKMRPGFLKDQAELAAKINLSETQRVVSNTAQNRAASAAVNVAKAAYDKAQAQLDAIPEEEQSTEQRDRVDALWNQYRDAKLAAERLPEQQAKEAAAAQGEYTHQLYALALQQREKQMGQVRRDAGTSFSTEFRMGEVDLAGLNPSFGKYREDQFPGFNLTPSGSATLGWGTGGPNESAQISSILLDVKGVLERIATNGGFH